MTEQAPSTAQSPSPSNEPPVPLERPAPVTIAGIVLISGGALTLLLALLALLAATILAGVIGSMGTDFMAGLPVAGAIAGILWFFVFLIGGIGALLLVTGIKVLGGASWARPTGIVVAVIGAVFSLGGLGDGGNSALSLAFLVAYGYTAYALWTNPGWFEARHPV